MKKIVTIVGARPQFVKLAPFSREVRKSFREIIIHTGQHYDANMSDSFFEELGIAPPDHRLQNRGGGQGRQTGHMLGAIEEVLVREEPDFVVIFGDTNSTLAGTLAAVKLGIPTAHVEAGLRSFNRAMPEEINRLVADHACDLLFAPTSAAMGHLEREGLKSRSILTGDIMVDAVRDNRERAEQRSDILQRLGLQDARYSLLTLHRPYTVDDPLVLERLLDQLAELEEPVLFPVHPRTRATLHAIGYPPSEGRDALGGGIQILTTVEKRTGSLRFVEPVGYLDFIYLQSHARRILTDSGGIQKEAYLLRKPCITLRPETEWVETVEAGWNLLLPPDTINLVERIHQFHPPGEQPAIFGANVARRMVEIIKEQLRIA